MSDMWCEIDFVKQEARKSGDSIALRYGVGSQSFCHIVDGGHRQTGRELEAHLRNCYGKTCVIDRMVVTHPDSDHVSGLLELVENVPVKELWMNRPWLYAEELLPRFKRFTSAAGLQKRLRELYPFASQLETSAINKGIPIRSPLQGQQIGPFTVLAPSRERLLDLIVDSDRTPEAHAEERDFIDEFLDGVAGALRELTSLVVSTWGDERFSSSETSAENEMSVVQWADFGSESVLLTGDVGRAGLKEALDYGESRGFDWSSMGCFQVPHHGSRRNLNTELLDRMFGQRVEKSEIEEATFSAVVSASKEDRHHPRKVVLRALIHRGGNVFSNEGGTVCYPIGKPLRAGWSPATPLAYPEDQDE